MPFCSQCGKAVNGADLFCAGCGGRQPVAPPSGDPFSGIQPRTASILCYIPGLGWIASIVVLASERFRARRDVRFHAFQGLYLFVAWLIEDWVLRPMLRHMPGFQVHHVLQAVLLVAAIFMMVKASHEQAYSLPIIGELAQRSVAET